MCRSFVITPNDGLGLQFLGLCSSVCICVEAICACELVVVGCGIRISIHTIVVATARAWKDYPPINLLLSAPGIRFAEKLRVQRPQHLVSGERHGGARNDTQQVCCESPIEPDEAFSSALALIISNVSMSYSDSASNPAAGISSRRVRTLLPVPRSHLLPSTGKMLPRTVLTSMHL